MMNTAWMMERMVVHSRRTWIRNCWVGCGIVGPEAELRAAWAWGAQEGSCWKLMTLQVLSFLCDAPKQCVCSLPELSVRMWWGRFEVWQCSAVPGVSIEQRVIQTVLSPVCCWRQTQQAQIVSAFWGWPSAPAHHNSHKKEERESLSVGQ